MSGMSKLSNYRTTWEHDANSGSVTYVNTRIVSWDGDTVTLNSGGWMTVTTKRKMCQAANQFGLRFCVFQRKGEWYVNVRNTANSFGALDMPFFDGMRFDKFTGKLVS